MGSIALGIGVVALMLGLLGALIVCSRMNDRAPVGQEDMSVAPGDQSLWTTYQDPSGRKDSQDANVETAGLSL